MTLVFNGSTNTIGGLAVGGVPDGTIDTDALAADAVTNAKANLIGEVFAWAHMDVASGTPTFNKSAGFGAITDNGTGDFTFALSQTQADNDYICLGTGSVAYVGGECSGVAFERKGSDGDEVNNTTTAVRVNVVRPNDGSVYDAVGNVYIALIHEG